jgi:hypothetical protein
MSREEYLRSSRQGRMPFRSGAHDQSR